MLRRSVCVWSSVVVLTVCSSGYAQVDGFPARGGKDYFSAIRGSPAEAQEVRELELRPLREALIYMQQGKPREAIRYCTAILARFVNHPKGFAILGMAARLVKEPVLPIPYFERALQLYPAQAMTHAQYGKYLAEIGKSAEGVKRLQRAIEINPQLHVAYSWLARVYVQQGQSDLARQILLRGREAEALQAQGLTAGADPMADLLQPGTDGGGETSDEKKTGDDSVETKATEGPVPTEQRKEEHDAAQ